MEKVAIIGSGLVGKSWAMIFASVGYKVTLYDIDPQQVQKALDNIQVELEQFEKDGVLRGNLKAAEQQPLISGSTDLEQSVKVIFYFLFRLNVLILQTWLNHQLSTWKDVVYIQECVPENLALKKKVWAQVDNLVQDSQTILASSSSCIIPSQISEDLKHRDQFMVAHPVNPPYHAPMVELVPASWTRQDIRERSRAIMKEIGQVPVSLSREVPGFILNRMQYALLNECFRLILDGVVSADDLDVVMRDGLGLRYAFMGPMETIHLNAMGLEKYCQTYGETISNVSKTMGEIPSAWLMQTDADKSQVQVVLPY